MDSDLTSVGEELTDEVSPGESRPNEISPSEFRQTAAQIEGEVGRVIVGRTLVLPSHAVRSVVRP